MEEANIQRLRSEIHGNDARLRADAIHAAIAHPEDTTALLSDFYQLFRSGVAPVASYARAAIGRYKSIAVPFLIQLLDSDDSLDRRSAIQLLLGLGHNRSSWRINEQILDDRPNAQPPWNSYRDDVLARLNAALADADRDVRVMAAITLDEIGRSPPNVLNHSVDGPGSNEDTIRNLSALHLGRMGHDASSDCLL